MEKEEVIERLLTLFKMDVDAVNAYEKALKLISEQDIREQIASFKDDHAAHINNISLMLRDFGAQPPEKHTGIRGLFLTEQSFSGVSGTEDALTALKKGEELSSKLYEIAVELPFPPDIRVIIDKNFRDELKHKRYVDHALDVEIWEQ